MSFTNDFQAELADKNFADYEGEDDIELCEAEQSIQELERAKAYAAMLDFFMARISSPAKAIDHV